MSLPRPYTSYNLFSQLERQYILQKLLGYTPTLSPAEVFDSTNYPDIPPLPPRYDGVILLWDWHIPGKTQRHKRKHRKSHGKIGFRELNKRISEAWSVVDNDVRNFCTLLSEIEGQKYKKAKKEEQKKQRKNKPVTAKNSSTRDLNFDFYDFDWTVIVDNFPREHSTLEIISSTEYRRIPSFNEEGENENFAPLDSDGRNLAEVDVSDDEIMNIWRSTQVEHEIPVVEIPLSTTCPEDEGRKSFIDAEYEMFVDLGKRFKAKKQSLSLLTRHRRLTFSASQA